MTYATHHHFRNLIGIAAVFVAAGCRGDLTAPDYRLPSDAIVAKDGVLTGAATAKVAGVHRHKAKNGEVYTIDHARSTLTNSKGKSVRLTPALRDKMEVSFDHMNAMDAVLDRFHSDPGYAKRLANEVGKKHKLLRATKHPFATPNGASNLVGAAVSGQSPAGTAARIPGPSRTSSILASDAFNCADIALAIMQVDAEYQQARAEYDQQLAIVTGNGLKGVPEALDLWDMAELEGDLAQMEALLTQLNILAVLYNSYLCWNNDWQVPPDSTLPPLPGTVGDGSGGGGGSGLTCENDYVVIEVSYDDGATWEVWWEGNAQVCW
jgi:hypothetical protein